MSWLVAFLIPILSQAAQPVLAPGPLPAKLEQEKPLSRLPATQQLNLALSLPLRNPALLDQTLQQLYDPTSRNYHRWLKPKDLAKDFGATQHDYQALRHWARDHGLEVTATHDNRLVLDVAGSVAQIEAALHVTLYVYQHPTEARTFYAPDKVPSLDLAVPVLTVAGLDTYWVPQPNYHLRPPVGPSVLPQAGSGPSGGYAGCDFRAAYVPGTLLTGVGQSVGLVQFDGFYPSDITAYATQFGLPNVPLTVVPIDGGVSVPGGNNAEVALDIEMVMAMAPGISRIYVYEAPNPSPWIDLLSRIQTDNLCKQVSCSWLGGGPDAASENIFKLMAAQGQSFFNASGDWDAFTGAVGFPTDSTNITLVGGTTLSTTGPCGSYSSETVWNWNNGLGTGGGISTYYSIPSYQLGIDMTVNQGSTTMRNIPDVALTADNVYVRYNNGGAGIFGGTSCAAPLWAGFTALVNQQATAAGRATVGFLNPSVYLIGKSANYATSFHDTTVGNNTWSSSPTRYYATAGYDLCTGWGTPTGTNLVNVLAGPPLLLPVVVSNSFALLVESCTNNAIDAGETVTVVLGLSNVGTANTTNLVATLQSSGGVVPQSGPQTYGRLVAGGAAVALPFTFSTTGSCGDTNIATLRLQDGTANLGTVSFAFRLGQVPLVFAQSFDGVAAPGLPAGWTTAASGAEVPWVTSTTSFDTRPNSVFSPDPGAVGLNELDSPVFTLPAGGAQLTFRHLYNLETSFDGGVLEIAVAGGAWTDILSAGGSFVSGGYNGTLSTGYQSPLGGRQAWTGSSGGSFITTTVSLPPSAAGQSAQLRWRCATDNSVSATGWYVDSVVIGGSAYVCCVPPPVIQSIGRNGTQVIVTWTAVAGRTYQVQYKNLLAPGAWTALPNVIATGSSASVTNNISGVSQRFYRVALLP